MFALYLYDEKKASTIQTTFQNFFLTKRQNILVNVSKVLN